MANPWEKYQTPESETGRPWESFAPKSLVPDGAAVVHTDDRGGSVYIDENDQFKYVSPHFETDNQADIISMLEPDGKSIREVAQSQLDRAVIARRPIAARADAAVRGIPFVGEFMDEATGALLGEDAMREQRMHADAVDRELPGQSLAMQMGTGFAASLPIAPVMPALPFVAKTGALGSKVRAGVAYGAPAGAVEGALSAAGREHDGSRLDAAKSGAMQGLMFGTLLGFGLPILAAGAGKTLDGFVSMANRVRGIGVKAAAKEMGVSPAAVKRMMQAIEDDGGAEKFYYKITGKPAKGNEGEIVGQGDLGSIASVGEPNIRALANEVVISPGKGVSIAADATGKQVEDAFSSATGMVDSVLGSPGVRKVISSQASKEGRAETSRLYEVAGRTVIDPKIKRSRAVFEALGRVPVDRLRKAFRLAVDNAQMHGQRLPAIKVLDDGTIVGDLTIGHLNGLKKSLQQIAYHGDNFDELTGKFKTEGKNLSMIANVVKKAAVGYSEKYRIALARAASVEGMERALELGEKLVSTKWTTSDALRFIERLDPAERAWAIKGVRNHIAEVQGNVTTLISQATSEGADVAASARGMADLFRRLSSPNTRKKLSALLGGPEADALFREIDKASIVANLRMQVAVGSKTGLYASGKAVTDAMFAPKAFSKLSTLRPVEAAQRVAEVLTDQTAEAISLRKSGYYAEIATVLLKMRGDDATKALSVFMNRKLDRVLTKSESRIVITALAKGGFFTASGVGAERGVNILTDENDRQNRVRRGDRAGVTGLSDADLDAAIREAQNGP